MAIRGPKNAIPTTRGWVNPKTGELLKSQKITIDQIAEWHGNPVPQTLHEAPAVERPLAASEVMHHYDNEPVVTENGQDIPWGYDEV